MKTALDYQSHFNTELYPDLTDLEKQRKGILSKVITAKILGILLIMMFLSVFMGFLNAFPFQEFDMGVAIYIFEGFFYFVLSLVVVMLMHKSLKYIFLIKGDKEIIKNKQKMYLYSIFASVVVIACAYFIGKAYLGAKVFTAAFFIRYASAIFTMIALGLISNVLGSYEKKFNLALKKETLPKILKYIKSGLKYEPESFIRQIDFVDSRIFPNKDIHSFKGSDFVTGSYGEGLFAFSQLDVKEITRTRSQGKTETKVSDLFKGLFYIADFNKTFKGKTAIYPDYARSILGAQFGEMLNQAMKMDNTHLVTFEDVEFEKDFAVYSTDQVEARYILSPTLIERIKSIKQKLESDLYFSFINNRVYVAIPSDLDVLVPIIFRDMSQFESMEPIYYTIDALLNIAQDLQLNTRIWGEVSH
jgi:hypothetical protein